ncbi:AraC family transcriptional regulator N-terminal domain-containing protein [uncultured Campylobacter sp.]|uniref:AraC family transcriptional regulator N-terminal domain-containing protein n=1 Tax=uncultured Campylobacter sp. TaxID=218934 RepID=UPI00260C7C01|nr:AraC family transcriptional regulator N-terminal domain-containing protein [uncultured Campylobacter sp.]
MSIYEPSACLCLRGGKMVEFSGKQYLYDTQKFLLCASYLPILGQVEHCSFLSVSIKFQSEDILKALKEIEGQSRAGRLLWLV